MQNIDLYFRHPLMTLSMIDRKIFKCFFSRHLIPKRCTCNICGKTFHNHIAHGNDTECSRMHDTTMGLRFSDCPWCGVSDKHRFLWEIIDSYLGIEKDRNVRVLHFAPEKPIQNKLVEKYIDMEYISGDLSPGKAQYIIDMTDIHYPDNSFDIVIASQVLEHVPDETKALKELGRVIKENGVIVLSVPIAWDVEKTKDEKIEDSKKRENLYGQSDHVRLYGKDYAERIQRISGLKVKQYVPRELFNRNELSRRGYKKCPPIILLMK